MKPWKSALDKVLEAIGKTLQWGHGDEAVEEIAHENPRPRRTPRFNGATAMKPWKRRYLFSGVMRRE